MNRTDRLYALVEELRAVAPRPRSARQLAQRYEVSTRTIERDILALQESGVPIYAETGRAGGYVIDKTLTLPPVNFTAAEMAAIAVALARDEATPFAAATRSALRKVLASGSAAQATEAAQLLDRIRLISPPAAAPDTAVRPRAGQPPASVPLAIQEAITAGHVLRLEYADRKDQVTRSARWSRSRSRPPAASGTCWPGAGCAAVAGRSGWTGSGASPTPVSRHHSAATTILKWTSRTPWSAAGTADLSRSSPGPGRYGAGRPGTRPETPT